MTSSSKSLTILRPSMRASSTPSSPSPSRPTRFDKHLHQSRRPQPRRPHQTANEVIAMATEADITDQRDDAVNTLDLNISKAITIKTGLPLGDPQRLQLSTEINA